MRSPEDINIIKINGMTGLVQKFICFYQKIHEEVFNENNYCDWSVEEETDKEDTFENAVITFYSDRLQEVTCIIIEMAIELISRDINSSFIPLQITYSFARGDRECGGSIITFNGNGKIIDEKTEFTPEFACEIFGEKFNDWRLDQFTEEHDHDLKKEMFVESNITYFFDVDCETLVFDVKIPQMYNQSIACRFNEDSIKMYMQPIIELNETDKVKMTFDIHIDKGVPYINAEISANDKKVQGVIALNRKEIKIVRKYLEDILGEDLCDLYDTQAKLIDVMDKMRGYYD